MFRESNDGIEIALIRTGPVVRWQLPKGHVDRGESPEQTAVREAREETGLDAVIERPLESIGYWFVGTDEGGERVRFHKIVHFFLMRQIGGDVSRHDREVEEARWVGEREVLQLLTFANERKVVEQALTLLRRG